MALLDRFKKKKIKKEVDKASAMPAKQSGVFESKEEKIKPKKDEKQKLEDADRAGRYAHILLKPHVTEKSTHAVSQNKYIFEIPPRANKTETRSAIQAVYNIDPVNVRIINTSGRSVRLGKIQGKRKDIKKAIITLPQGKKLDIYEG